MDYMFMLAWSQTLERGQWSYAMQVWSSMKRLCVGWVESDLLLNDVT